MRRFVLFIAVCLSFPVCLSAQDVKSLAWSYKPYPDVETPWTKAPAGYKPVYISAFSRHGSRYLLSDDNYSKPLEILETAGRGGYLTPAGKELLEDVRKIADDAIGLSGMLLPRGGREHRHIMERTIARYPEIFSGNDCAIDVYASTSQRCIMSMAYSLDAITAKNPKVRYDRHCGPKVQAEVFNSFPVSAVSREYGRDYDQRVLDETANEAVLNKIFTYSDAQKASLLDPVERKRLVRWLWELTIDNALNDELGVDLYKYFDYNDFYGAWRVNNWKEYFIVGPSEEFGEIVRNEASTTLRHMIEHADKALAGGKYKATLRYGHDSQLAPLAVEMDIEGSCSPVADTDHPEASWILENTCPMGANIQMVFFKKKGSKDILVKVLLNENESRIAGVKTDKWPFYHWSDLREHYMESLEKRPDFNRGGWQKETIQDGLIYMRYSGMEPVSRARQIVSVVDVDLNNPRYSVKFTLDEDRITTSDAFKKAGAVATINATYERESSFIKVDGKIYDNVNSDVVPYAGAVPQWKSDCTVSTDGRNVKIEYTGKDKNLQERREAFASIDSPNVFGCAPMLIDNYIPVGKYFATSTLSKEEIEGLYREDPYRHQAVRHPRSAVALTEDNHLLLITVDGRRPGIAEGMSAFELTSFIENHFHAKDAMNLDGGGSTTLCVKGQGSDQTNVVNYPSGSRTFKHDNERRVVTHIHILDSSN
ncbi:MAG: phosphodiester glycosidase family protein [Bacteroidales bacterium]|nr:phosphodiester glycosidase family protein [Bacteroidales bacterium]